MLSKSLTCIALLICSNVFMNLAWYGHLKWFKDHKTGMLTFGALALPILVSWLLALPEYCLQVPANRIGHQNFGGPFTAPQLKIIQEAVTLIVFTLIAFFVLHEKPRWTDGVAMLMVLGAVAVSVWGRRT